MTLGSLLAGVEVIYPSTIDRSLDVQGITCQPQAVGVGFVFAQCRVPWLDPIEASRSAIARGAAVIMAEQHPRDQLALTSAGVVQVKNINQAYAIACANYFSNAHCRLRLYGVTGTKGKTTTCHFIESAFRHAGLNCGLISTLAHRTPRHEWPSSMTTPEPSELHRLLSVMDSQGVRHVVIEVSSIGLAEERVYGLQFDGVVFTNVGHEHLEYHGSRDAYIAAKSRLFRDRSFHSSKNTVCVLNSDDAIGAMLAADAVGKVISYGCASGDIKPTSFESDELRTMLRIESYELHSRFGGVHNVYNLLAAFALTQAILGSAELAIQGLQTALALPGRLEHIHSESDIDVFVDYAHTPESVQLVLQIFRCYAGSRKRAVVIGCGGGTTKSKRPLIAHAALAGSDILVLTADNPRFEDPVEIIRDMVAGIDVEALVRQRRLCIVPDRAQAIKTAIDRADPNGIVLILGKGHERTNEVQGRLIPFDDREVARNVLRTQFRMPRL